jgi:AraC family ethanolamine operon transcriptional activator
MSTESSYDSGRLEVVHIEQLQQMVFPWQVQLQQLSPGEMISQMEFLLFNDIMLYREFWSQSIYAIGLSPAGYQMFGNGFKSPTSWCGKKIDGNTYAHGHTDIEMSFNTPADSHHVVLLLPDEIYESNFAEDEDSDHTLHEQHHTYFSGRPSESPVVRWNHLISKYLTKPEQLINANIRNGLQAILIDDMAKLITGPRQHVPYDGRQGNLIVRRAMQMIESLDEVVPIPQLAKRLGISQRVLEMAFRKVVGKTPSKIMRWHRLQRVHDKLLRVDADAVNISSVALEWGFVELGRFSVEYRQLFHEKPSDTLRRSYQNPRGSYLDLLQKK